MALSEQELEIVDVCADKVAFLADTTADRTPAQLITKEAFAGLYQILTDIEQALRGFIDRQRRDRAEGKRQDREGTQC